MAFYKLRNIPVDGQVGDVTENRYGHPCEIREDGMYVDIPDDIIDGEIEAGRVFEGKKEKPAPKQEKVTELDDLISFDEVNDDAAKVVKEGSGKRKGRPSPKGK